MITKTDTKTKKHQKSIHRAMDRVERLMFLNQHSTDRELIRFCASVRLMRKMEAQMAEENKKIHTIDMEKAKKQITDADIIFNKQDENI